MSLNAVEILRMSATFGKFINESETQFLVLGFRCSFSFDFCKIHGEFHRRE